MRHCGRKVDPKALNKLTLFPFSPIEADIFGVEVSDIIAVLAHIIRTQFLTVYGLLQASGVRLGMLFQAASSIIAGLIIGFIYSWQLALMICAVAPLMAIAGFIEMRIVMGASHKDKEALKAAGKVCQYTYTQ